MTDATDAELRGRFSSANANIEPDIMAELKSIMRLHSIDTQELWYKWESYSMKMGSDDMKLNIDTARALKESIQSGLERENRNKAHVQSSGKRGGAAPRNIVSGSDVFGMLDGLVPNTPGAGSTSKVSSSIKRRPHETPSTSRVKAELGSSPPTFKSPYKSGERNGQPISFNERTNAGQEVEVLNQHLAISDPPIAPYSQSRIRLVANSDIKKLSYKPLAMKSSEASEILDDRIDEFMALIQGYHKLEDSQFGNAASQSINEIVAVGRIASDSLEGKLNASSLVLETSRRMGGGLRIPLRLQSLPGFQFFPGQVVAMRGINSSGTEFTVSEILEVPLLGGAASAPANLEAHVQRLKGDPDAMEDGSDPAPLNILLGAGPYSADDNLDFEPLHALCSQAADTYADALMLTGPFIDIDHPLIASGDFELPQEAMIEMDTITMSTVFKYMISPILNQLVSANPHITIILVPSVKDAISKHVSWPQEPFPRQGLGLPKAVKIIGNPMVLSLNEISVGISSLDVFTELRHEEVLGGSPKDTSLLARLPKYVIEQRNFFPLFPPSDRKTLFKTGTAEEIPAGAMLDVSYLKLGEMANVRPDLMIIPSYLPPFAKVVESVVVVNPGYLSKRRGAGTYTKLTIHPYSMTVEEKGSKTMIGHKVFERARVDIMRI
ncbi:DNA polymerase alpha subunit B N-terminal-domain-containing protein [Calycina marina]|uniref:DNA polymerase alpha subunit B n=1 Tax=Calycina marina TaxID=1763456 RepID=A0A9P7Z741_9HELO|nr:DNA polymerase alpha subunit B N-terminal-domain-containing protein [Calycina marina]